jgi:small GTP-binding protein
VILLTPYGHGGIAVVAAASAAERRALLACLRAADGGAVEVAPGSAPRRCALVLGGAVCDDVLVVDRASGLEVHLHGSPGLLDRLAAQFGPWSVRPPTAVERLLREALAPAQLDLALEQAQFEQAQFGQAGCGFDAFLRAAAALPPAERARELARALRRSAVARALARPQPVAIVGAQNAGKSTLFNRLLFTERALTGPLPGLTRDPLRERTTLSGYPYELVDTAGEGAVATPVDAAAQRLARAAAADAVRLLVIDASTGPRAADRAPGRPGAQRTLVIANKSDLPAAPWPGDFACDLRLSCADPAQAPAVRAAVGEALRRLRGLPAAGAVGGPAALDDASWRALTLLAGAAGAEEA